MLLTETNQLSRLQIEQLQKFGENVNRLGEILRYAIRKEC